jgi:copper homeostasis protein
MLTCLEVIVQSVADAEEAEAGGADRLEVVREIERDGLTPPLDLVRSIIGATSLPLRVMVRESDGFGITRPKELIALQRAFADLADLGVHGAVVGFAREGALDLDLIASVLSVAPGLRVTLHRAFDSVHDPESAIDAALAFPQIDRILTSGGNGDWAERCERMTAWARRAGPRITILPGGGVDEQALQVLAACPAITEAHVGKAAREPQISTAPVSAVRVRRLQSLIAHR